MTKPILCLDFDGVLHSYTSGWKGADVIPDPPVPGALQFIVAAMEHFQVAIFSSRSHQAGGQQAMREWIGKWSVDPVHGMPSDFDHGNWSRIDWPLEKPAAMVTIDDRAIQFTGRFPDPRVLTVFRPWNKLHTAWSVQNNPAIANGMRRAHLEQNTQAELAIRAAMDAVEALPPDTRLSAAVTALNEARERVADYVDGIRPIA